VNQPEHFEILDTHAVFRPTGEVSLEQAVRLVTSGIAFAREQRVQKLLVVTSGLTGFRSPDAIERYLFIQEWAAAADLSGRIAFVGKIEMIDPEKIGITMAASVGLVCDVFESEGAALAWLLGVK
jgi:hypothetical protein